MAPGALVVLLLLLGRCDGVCALSAPSGLSAKSINMRHTLSWLPLQDGCDTTVLYSVQYQGDFERLMLNGTWLDAARCQLMSPCQCDLSSELGSDSDYNLRVRAHCGSVLSPWQQLVPPFNRNETELLAPWLKLDMQGDSLLVSLEDVPQICSVRVFLWRAGLQEQALERVVRSELVMFDSVLQEGEEYCVQAQIELPSGRRSSPTAPHCVHIPGPEGLTREKLVTVVFTVLLSVGFICTVLWFVVHCSTQTCICHKEALPKSLQENWNVSVPVQIQEEEKVLTVQVIQEAPPPSIVAPPPLQRSARELHDTPKAGRGETLLRTGSNI